MQKRTIFLTFFAAVFIYLTSCSDSKNIGSAVFNPDQPIEVTGFYPDSGGIATPMIVEGRNFGSDTTNLKVYFEDVDGIKHPAGLVSYRNRSSFTGCRPAYCGRGYSYFYVVGTQLHLSG